VLRLRRSSRVLLRIPRPPRPRPLILPPSRRNSATVLLNFAVSVAETPGGNAPGEERSILP